LFTAAAVLVAVLFLISAALHRASVSIPTADEDSGVHVQPGRTMQRLYFLEYTAHTGGWTSESLASAAQSYRLIGDLTAASVHYERALLLDPQWAGRADAMRSLAEIYLEQGDWARTFDVLQSLSAAAPSDWVFFQLSLIAAPVDPEAALAFLERTADPAYRSLLSDLRLTLTDMSFSPLRVGMLLLNRDLLPYAEHAFAIAAESATDSEIIALALAYGALARDRQGKSGGEWIARAVALNPTDFMVRYLQGLHLRHVGDDRGSLNALIAAAALNPQDPALFAELGAAYRLVGDMTSAERWLREAVRLSNGDPRFTALLTAFEEAQRSELQAYFEQILPLETALPPAFP
jgi:tetratricopeptide (TPR) repeat protein